MSSWSSWQKRSSRGRASIETRTTPRTGEPHRGAAHRPRKHRLAPHEVPVGRDGTEAPADGEEAGGVNGRMEEATHTPGGRGWRGMRLRAGPFRRPPEAVRSPGQVLSVQGIILENGLTSSPRPLSVWTGAELRGVMPVLSIGLQSTFNPPSIDLQSITPSRPVVSRVGEPQTPIPLGPNNYPNPRVLEGLYLPTVSLSPVTSLQPIRRGR